VAAQTHQGALVEAAEYLRGVLQPVSGHRTRGQRSGFGCVVVCHGVASFGRSETSGAASQRTAAPDSVVLITIGVVTPGGRTSVASLTAASLAYVWTVGQRHRGTARRHVRGP